MASALAEPRQHPPVLDGVALARRVVHHVPEAGDVARVLPAQQRRVVEVDDGGEAGAGGGAADPGLGLAPAGEAGVRVHPDDDGIEAGNPAEVADEPPFFGDRHVAPGGLDVGDPHGAAPPGMAWPSARRRACAAGCPAYTPSPAPPIRHSRSVATRASSSTTAPRETFNSQAPGLIRPISA